MCSRYFLELQALLELEKQIDYEFERSLCKDYSPSDEVLVITNNQEVIQKANWGFKSFNNQLIINARSETLLEKSMFKKEVINHRCVIIASGFYEWEQHKHRFSFIRPDSSLMMMAGIYRIVDNKKEVVIITTKANKSIMDVHRRMPLILDNEQIELWLSDNFKDVLKITPPLLKIKSGILQQSLF